MSATMHPVFSMLTTAACSFLIVIGNAQTTSPPTKDLFTTRVVGSGTDRYINLEPDSTTGHPALDARSKALFWHHMYLFENFSNTAAYVWKLTSLLPDTPLIQARLDSSFAADTAFTKLYARAMTGERVDPLPIDSALKIAAHFFYLHSERGKPVVHVCVGINKVKALSQEIAHPYHAAFCYQAIWRMKDNFQVLKKVKAPYSKEFKKRPPTEARIQEVEALIYSGMASRPELRKALIDTYERSKEHWNFELVY